MKATLYRNIELVRIPIQQGVKEYHFPQNVDWADKVIDKLIACIPSSPYCVDPMDGTTHVLSVGDLALQNACFNLYDSDNNEIMHMVAVDQITMQNNHPIMVNKRLDLKACSIVFAQAPAQDAVLLLYAFHGSKDVEIDALPENSVTFTFPLAANEEINFQQIIQTYIHALPARVRGIIFWTDLQTPAYFTLRDYEEKYVLRDIHSEMARPDMNRGAAFDSQVDLMLFDSIDIDFQYSHIRNAVAAPSTQKVTILY